MWPGQGANGPLRAPGRGGRAAGDKLDWRGAVCVGACAVTSATYKGTCNFGALVLQAFVLASRIN
jgi:hypothetical protein